MQLINHYESKEFYYESENERNDHEREMVKNGWKCTGQMKKNIGNFIEQKSVWYACYCKYYKDLLNIVHIVERK